MLSKGLLLAVDANSLLHRAYHAYPITLTSAENQPVNAVYGFTAMLLDAILQYKPEYIFCAFDTAKPTFRHTSYVGYKANRKQTDSELVLQIPYVYEVLNALNIPTFAIPGFEADDILGTISTKVVNERLREISQTYILTGDRDLFQLVNEKVQVILPKGSFKNLEVYHEQEVMTRMGVPPSLITDLKGLMGDASDNIPGVKGIGPKTAVELLTRFGTLEKIYENLDAVKDISKRTAQLLIDDHESAIMSKELATITAEVPVTFKPEDAETKVFNAREVTRLFNKFQFKSLFPRLKRLITVSGNEETPFEEEHVEVPLADLSVWGNIDSIGVKTQSVLGKTFSERVELIKSIQKDIKNNEVVVVIYCNETIYQSTFLPKETVFKNVDLYTFGFFDLFSNAKGANLTENVPEIDLSKILDIELLSYAMHTGRDDYSLQSDLLQANGGALQQELESNPEKVIILALARILSEKSQAKQYQPFERVSELWKNKVEDIQIPQLIAVKEDMALAFGVALMRYRGILIDTKKITETVAEFREKLTKVEKEIVDIVGFEFNVRSTKQIANVLFGNLGLPNAKKTKTGFSTDDEVLQGLLGAHPVIEKILEHRQFAKLVSTYMEPYLEIKVAAEKTESIPVQQSLFAIEEVSEKIAPIFDGRVHSQFTITGTSSGRLSSSNPNLQNLPVKTELSKVIREFFIPEKGNKLVSIDYSQIDLRVLAHISEDEGLIEAFMQGRDIHRSTAAKVFHTEFEKVTDQQRRFSKSINFGLIYGMSAFGLSRSIGVDMHEAAKFIQEYFEQFPKVKEYMLDTVRIGKELGYVESLLGRRRFVPGLTSQIKPRAQAAERETINMPIQGGSDDIMRLALGKITMLPTVLSGQIKLVLQIHDELVFEMPEKLTEPNSKTIENLIDIMEKVIELKVPLKAESEVGATLAG